jgi:hypothetical protein
MSKSSNKTDVSWRIILFSVLKHFNFLVLSKIDLFKSKELSWIFGFRRSLLLTLSLKLLFNSLSSSFILALSLVYIDSSVSRSSSGILRKLSLNYYSILSLTKLLFYFNFRINWSRWYIMMGYLLKTSR